MAEGPNTDQAIMKAVKIKLESKISKLKSDERRGFALETFSDALPEAENPLLLFYQLIIAWFNEPFLLHDHILLTGKYNVQDKSSIHLTRVEIFYVDSHR